MSKWNYDPSKGGIKQDLGKTQWHLLPDELLEGVIAVLEVGAEKYSEWNWANGMPYSRVYDSLRRHLNALWKSENLDPETNLPHIDHLICNALFLKYFMQRYPDLDDRPIHLRAPITPPAAPQDCSSATHPEATPSGPVRKGGPFEADSSGRQSERLPLPDLLQGQRDRTEWNPPPPGSVLFEIQGKITDEVPEWILDQLEASASGIDLLPSAQSPEPECQCRKTMPHRRRNPALGQPPTD